VLIDWFTVVAQIVNFLILVLLLRRFLYRPILRMMDEREAKIAARLEDARRIQAEAHAEAETYRQHNQELAESREAAMFEAKEEAEAWRKKLIARAHEELDEARGRWYASVRQEQAAFIQDVRHRIGQQVIAIARQALTDLADADLEERMIAAFLQQINAMSQEERQRIAHAAEQAGSQVSLHTTFELSPEMEEKLTAEVRDVASEKTTVTFLRDPSLICGIQARIESHKIAWTLDDHLATLAEQLFEALAPSEGAEERHDGELATAN
jgi:F-type H+-transporting ATPase subunit b